MGPLTDNLPRFRFRDLPDDLIRTVFEASANNRDEFSWSLVRVSKTVRSWVEPVLYRNISLDHMKPLHLLHDTITSYSSSKPSSFYSAHVRRLYFGDPWVMQLRKVINILLACSNVTRLSATMLVPGAADDCLVGNHKVWEALRPTWLTINPCLFSPTHRHFRFTAARGSDITQTCNPIFTNVTHLELYFIRPSGDIAWSWSTLSLLSTLTHLCIATISGHRALDCASWNLRAALPWFPPALVVCVFAIPRMNSHFPPNEKQLVLNNGWRVDPRIVAAVSREYYMSELEKGPEGAWIEDEAIYRWNEHKDRADDDDAFWERAVAMVQRRREAIATSTQAGG
ncbi:hypothetical protein DFP72DRAFT_931145 [Ephemerocybe angulata]|uniref:Uncharacterized protein n=1 Tax=Ephemerocybe angulata TaxID=980116 RepID=A0A8H6HCE4_9AGAR|nr:hypothetical protein DFP72DRAFT_931145 [Tulosesus angulatus]